MKTVVPRVSVLLPVKGSDDFFAQAVRSVLTQTMSDLELVVVLDGPNRIAESVLSDIDDDRIRAIPVGSSTGLAAALNTGLAACRADLVARLDADDVALPGRFERQVDELDRRPQLGVLGTWAYLIDSNGRYLGPRKGPTGTENVARALLWRNALIHPSVMVRRELVLQVGGYHEGLRRLEDYELWLRCVPICDVDNLAEPLLLYRLHRGQHSRGFHLSEEMVSDLRRAKIKAGRRVGASPTGVLARHAVWRVAQVRNWPPIRRHRRLA